ncbi:hypothetical protein [Mycolicibacterium sp. XJ1819]
MPSRPPMLKRGRTLAKRIRNAVRPGSASRPGAVPVPIVGNLGHMRGSLYAKIFDELNLEPVAPRHTTAASPFGLIWKPWIHGSAYDLSGKIAKLRRISPDIRLINDTAFTDDKLVVQREFERAFGYGLEVDPTTYVGLAVKKSRVNAKHDGMVVECPIPQADPEMAYQLLVDNVNEDGDNLEIRVSIMAYEPQLCHMKWKTDANRFVNWNKLIRLVPSIDELFSPDELAKMAAFARGIGLECGDMDVLRDNKSGKIYIVDANNTPYGPPNNIDESDAPKLLRQYADAFARVYHL